MRLCHQCGASVEDAARFCSACGAPSDEQGGTGAADPLIGRVVGGSYLEGDSEPGIRKAERDVLLKHAELLGIDTQKTQPIGEWTGFRPYRPTSRCEIDEKYDGIDQDVRIVHNYGYGGSGWTVYAGCAREAAELVLR